MKKNLLILLFTLSCSFSLEARFPQINPKWVTTVTAAASSLYGYYKKDVLQEKAVETTMHLIDEYAKPEKKDAYTSKVFDGLKKFKPSLLPLMKNHYDKRFFEHIKNETAPLVSEQQSLQEYTEVIAPQVTLIPAQTTEYLINHEPRAHSLFLDSAIQNIKSLKYELAAQLIQDRSSQNPLWWRSSAKKDVLEKISNAAKENYIDIDPETLSTLLLYNNELKDTFVDLAIQHPAKKYNNFLCVYNLLDSYIHPSKMDQQRLEKLTNCARENLDIVNSELINSLLFIKPSLANEFTDKIRQNIHIVQPHKLDMILDKISHKNRGLILDALREDLAKGSTIAHFSLKDIHNNNENRIQLIQIYNKHAHWFRKPLPIPALHQNLSQTEAHALVMQSAIKDKFGIALGEETIKNFVESLHSREKSEQQNDRITFVHGCAWTWDFKQDLFTKLMEIKYQKNFDSYRFLRFKSDYGETMEDEKMHQKLNVLEASELRQDVLFMNHALFSNAMKTGSCTFDYWLNNHDQSILQKRNKFTSADLFKNAELEMYFEKYKNEIKQLEYLHQKAENKGLILLISANKNSADNYIYPTKAGAERIVILTEDGKFLSKASKCIDKLKKDPINLGKKLDRLEYGMLLSNRYALNPDKACRDIKIFPFSLAYGTKEYAAYCNKRDQLINKIKQDIEEEKNPQLKEDRLVVNLLSTASA